MTLKFCVASSATAAMSSSDTPAAARPAGRPRRSRKRSIAAAASFASPIASPMRRTASGSAISLNATACVRITALARPCGMPRAATDHLRKPVVNAHRPVRQAAAGECGSGEHVGAGVEVVGVVDDAWCGVDDATDRLQCDRFGFGRAARRVDDLDAVRRARSSPSRPRCRAAGRAWPAGRRSRQRARWSARRRRSSASSPDRSCRRTA